jgi:flagellar protein FlaJ
MKFILSKESKIFLTSLIVALFLLIIGILSRDVGVIGNMIILSTFIVASPQLFLRYEKYRELKDMESNFPNFLRDLVESLRSGLPLHKAIQATSRLNYGKLSKEIKKMSNQISWGVPLQKVLTQFSERVKKSKRLHIATRIMKESYLAGGDIVAAFESLADNTTMLDEAEKERKTILSQYVLLMYAIAFIFVAIVVAINKLLIPIFQLSTTTPGFSGLSNPCYTCQGLGCNVCDLYSITAAYIFSIKGGGIESYYTSLFFFMAIIQGFFSGLVAGQISENSITAGIKHSLIITAIIFGSFSILVRLGFLGV